MKKNNTKKNTYIQSIHNHLKQQQGEIKPELQLSLKLLEDNFTLYERVNEQLKKEPLTNEVGIKNSLLTTHKDLTSIILKQLKELVVTIPFTELKNKKNDNQEESTSEFISNLLD